MKKLFIFLTTLFHYGLVIIYIFIIETILLIVIICFILLLIPIFIITKLFNAFLIKKTYKQCIKPFIKIINNPIKLFFSKK